MNRQQALALEAKIALSGQLDQLRAEANAITKHQQKIAMYTGVSEPRLLRRIEAAMHDEVEDLDSLTEGQFRYLAVDRYDAISNKVW